MTTFFLKYFLKRYRQKLENQYAAIKVETMQQVAGISAFSPNYKKVWNDRMTEEEEHIQKINDVQELINRIDAGFKVPEEVKNLGYCLCIVGMIYWLLILNLG